MNFRRLALPAFAAALLTLLPVALRAARPVPPRLTLAADADWKFLLGDPAGAETPSFPDASWTTVDLPHDWSIASHPDKDNPGGAGEGFYPGGIGWYRKSFRAPASWQGKRVSVEFDGVYRDATVYLNGRKLGIHPYGYTSFSFDLTPALTIGGQNLLAVRVDNSAQPNSRWYSGSGIYRHVRFTVTNSTHIAHWGTFVTTSTASDASASISVQTHVENDSAQPVDATVVTTFFDSTGARVGSAQSALSIPANQEAATAQEIVVAHPSLWSPDTPVLYRAVTQIRKDGKLLDENSTPFGIRTLAWSAQQGLLLNGKSIKLHGGSVHHDNGPLGAAAFDRAEERRVELLKAAGMNAVRTAHNPPSPAFLDACDRIGLLVLDEPFDVWEAHKVKFDYASDFAAWWKQDIESMVLRDRNHPSIVIWGIGNEIPEIEVSSGKGLARQLIEAVRSLDTTRPLTLAFPGTTTKPNAEAVFSQLDITGYNYNLLQSYAKDHQQLPARMMLTTESYPASAFPLWQASQANPYILGDLTWTAIDYLGESGIGAWSYGTPQQAKAAAQIMGAMANSGVVDQLFLGMATGKDAMAEMAKQADPAMQSAIATLFHGYPWHAAACGDLDLIGQRKPQSYYRDILWNGGDRVYATVRLPEPEGKKIIAIGWATYPTLPSWSWPGEEGKDLQVEVYSGAEKVRLFLNGKLIGEKPTGRDEQFKAEFTVPYEPGTLKAVGLRGDRVVAESVLATAASATHLRLHADRTMVQADGQDLSFITVEAVDDQGRWDPHADQEVTFSIGGPGALAAAANADQQDNASYQSTHSKLFEGRALVVVRTTRHPGRITLNASAPGLSAASASIDAKAAPSQPMLQ